MKMKKGNIRISYLIGGIIAVFILVLAGYFLFYYWGNLNNYISWIIPGFNQTKEGVSGIEIFRYNIPEGSAEYYDGIKWIEFKEVTVGGKKINAENLAENFEEYYFKERGDKMIPIGYLLRNFYQVIKDESGNSLAQDDMNYLIEKSVEETGKKESEFKINAIIGSRDISSGGNVIINLADENGIITRNAGYFILKLDNSMEFYYNIKEVYYTGTEGIEKESIKLSYSGSSRIGDIAKGAEEWRDSVFENPIPISYIGKEGGVEKSCSGDYPAVMKDNKYIVIDLGESIVEEKC